MADANDWTPVKSLQADDWKTIEQQRTGVLEAAGRGAMQGATFNFFDELSALTEAGGGGKSGDGRMGIDQLVRGAFKYWMKDPESVKRYKEAVAKERGYDKQLQSEHPIAYTGGELAGALALPGGSAKTGATLAARTGRAALAGATYGALSGAGEGEGAADSVEKAVKGGVVGGVGGAVAAPVVEGIAKVAKPIADRVMAPFRAATDPEAEATRRIGVAVDRDIRNDPAATQRLDPTEFASTPEAKVIDVGGETTRALARSAANTSPEGRAVLNRAIDERFEEQSPRLAQYLRDSFHYPNADAQQDALDKIARTVNRPAYAKAYSEGAKGLWDEGFEQITQAPVVQDAIRKAMISAKNDAAKLGFTPPKNPFQFDGNGRLKLKSDANGNRMLPNLQFWDIVKRNLDKTGTPEARDWARILREHADDHVPSYAEARAGAAKFFGAGDALEAGQNFVGASQRYGIHEARKALAKMSADERQLFQDGYVSRLVQNIEKTGDRRNVLNQIAQSPAAREELNVALGRQRASEVEAKLRIEGIMDLARGAVQGNSTTARQLVEAGLAGGVGAAGYSISTGDWSPKSMLEAAFIGGLARKGLAKGAEKIDERVARKVASMLVSDDPGVLARGLKMVGQQPRFLNALRAVDQRIARISGGQGNALPVQSLLPARAEPDQNADRQNVQGPRGQ